MHKSSMDKMLAFREKYLADKKEEALLIFDLGSFDVNGSYKPYFEGFSWKYFGVDMAPGKNVDILLQDPYCWREIKSDSADVVISGQAFEHIEFFWLTMLEISRVLKPGGLCCLIVPSSGPVHRYPVDCWRFYPDGFSALARFASLEVVEIYSQKEDTRYDDGSDMWQDILFVGRKPALSGIFLWKRRLKQYLLHRALKVLMRT